MRIIIPYLLFFCTLLPGILIGQDYNISIKHLTIEDGLSNQFVNHVFQSSKGFIWISTAKGLNRWDGYNMEIYAERMSINKVTEGTNGIIWLDYHRTHSDFKVQAPEAPIHIGKLKGGERLYADKWKVLTKTEDGVILLSIENNTVYLYSDKLESLPRITPYMKNKKVKFTDAVGNRFWLISNNEILLLDKDGKIYDQEKLETPPTSVQTNDKGELLFYINEIETRQLRKNLPNSIPIFIKAPNKPSAHLFTISLSTIKDYKVIFNSHQFINKRDRKGINWIKINHTLKGFNDEGIELFNSHQISTIGGGHLLNYVFFDKDENVWLATYDGVYSVQLSNFPFRSFLTNAEPGYSTRGILKYNDTLLIHTYKGTQLIDLSNENKVTVLSDIPKETFFYTVIEGDDGFLYFGEGLNRIYRYDRKQHRKKVLNQRFLDNHYARQQIPYLLKSNNEIWIGSTVGLSILNKDLEVLEYLTLDGEEETQPNNIRHFYENEKGLWIVARNGLFHVDAEERRIIQHYSKEKGTLPFNELNHLYEDEEGIFWIATQGFGLVKWNPKTKAYKSYGRGAGLLNLMVHAVYEDSYKRLWLPTDYGLILFDKELQTTRVFLVQDGLTSNEFNGFSHYRDEKGNLYFGGINGVNCFHPDSITNISQYEDPQLHITAVSLPDKKNSGQFIDLTDKIQEEEELVLQPNNTSFTLQFSYLDYYSRPNITYAYRIEGLDNNWIYQKENSIRFAHLPAGEYLLHVKAKGNTGLWTKNVIQLPVRVLKPFYQTTTFIIGLLLLAAFLVFTFIRLRTYRLRKNAQDLEEEVIRRTQRIEEQKERLEKLSQTKARLYGILAHDIRGSAYAFRGMASKINYLLEKNDMPHVLKLASYVEDSAEKLNKQLDELLDWAQQQEGELPFHVEQHNLFNMVQEVFSLLAIVAKNKNITFEYEGKAEIEITGDYQMLTTIIRNFLDNAIKFSFPDGLIKVKVFQKKKTKDDPNQEVHIHIEDQGIGMTKRQIERLFSYNKELTNDGTLGERGTGLGMILVRELADLHAAKINIESVLGEGTRVELIFGSKPHLPTIINEDEL